MKTQCYVTALLLFITSFFTYVEASVGYLPLNANPDYPGMCYIPETRRAYAVGLAWYDGDCTEISCQPLGDKFQLHYQGCSHIVPEDAHCRVVPGPDNAIYPECCERIECDDLYSYANV